MTQSKITFPISAKLVFLFSFLLGIVALSTLIIATKVFVENNSTLVQEMTSETAGQLAYRQRKILEGYQSNLQMAAKFLVKQSPNNTNQSWDFQNENSFRGVYLLETKNGGLPVIRNRILSPNIDGLDILSLGNTIGFSRVQNGEVVFSSIPKEKGQGTFVLGAPFMKDDTAGIKLFIIGVFDETEFIESFRNSEVVNSYLLNEKGEILAPKVLNDSNLGKDHPLVQKVKELTENYQTRFKDPNTNEEKIGALQAVKFSGLSVISEVSEARALEIVHRVRYRAGLVAAFVLSIAFLITYFFSKSITSPIERLVRAAELIREGNFHIRLKARSRDEVGHLSNAFNEMAAGLEERDRVKEVFSRFHNQQIADKILSGELALGGERKEAVIFFSDLRDFTSISEALEPEKVVEMINEYFTKMVAVIHKHNGIVDKYVGDAIVALWGIPFSSETSAKDAVQACLEMRQELIALNRIREGRGEAALRMGIGLHTGTVIVGNIGSDQRMEYTAIGDSVNLASRIQSMTKEIGEDFLVSDAIVSKLQSEFDFETKGTTHVKGKSHSVTLYTVQDQTIKKNAA